MWRRGITGCRSAPRSTPAQLDAFLYVALGPLLLPDALEETRLWNERLAAAVQGAGASLAASTGELKTELAAQLVLMTDRLTKITGTWQDKMEKSARTAAEGTKALAQAEKLIAGDLLTSVRESRDLIVKGAYIKTEMQTAAVALTSATTALQTGLTGTMNDLKTNLTAELSTLNTRLKSVADNVLKVEGAYAQLDAHLKASRAGQEETGKAMQATLQEWKRDIEITKSPEKHRAADFFAGGKHDARFRTAQRPPAHGASRAPARYRPQNGRNADAAQRLAREDTR